MTLDRSLGIFPQAGFSVTPPSNLPWNLLTPATRFLQWWASSLHPGCLPAPAAAALRCCMIPMQCPSCGSEPTPVHAHGTIGVIFKLNYFPCLQYFVTIWKTKQNKTTCQEIPGFDITFDPSWTSYHFTSRPSLWARQGLVLVLSLSSHPSAFSSVLLPRVRWFFDGLLRGMISFQFKLKCNLFQTVSFGYWSVTLFFLCMLIHRTTSFHLWYLFEILVASWLAEFLLLPNPYCKHFTDLGVITL